MFRHVRYYALVCWVLGTYRDLAYWLRNA